MASIKPVIRKGVVNKDGKANIKIELNHHEDTRYIATNYYIEPKMFRNHRVIDKHPNASFINMETN